MYKTNQKEVIELIKQKRNEGLSQTKVSDYLNENNYLYLNKYGNLVKFNQTTISKMENSIKKNNKKFKKVKIMRYSSIEMEIINKIEEIINKTNIFVLPLLFCSDEKFVAKIKNTFNLDIQEFKNDCFSFFHNKSDNNICRFITTFFSKFKTEFKIIKKIRLSKKGRGKGFKIYAKSLEDIKEFERKIKQDTTVSLPLFEKSPEVEVKKIKQKDKQFLALNLKLECDRLKSIDQYVAETEKEISDLNMRLEKLNQSILQYNKVRDLTKQQIEEIIQQIEEINKGLSNE